MPQQQQQQQQAREIIIRTYNVADLLWLANDYPLDSSVRPPTALRSREGGGVGGGGGGGGQAMFAGDGVVVGRKAAQPIELDPLSKLIVDTVEAESWKENGGNIGNIRFISSVLVIMQTRQNHDTIQQLLDELRRSAGSAQVVTVRAVWVQVGPGEIVRPTAEVTDDWMKKQKVYCESQLSCFSGQTVHISSGAGRQVTVDATPIVGTSAVAFDPTVEQVLSGVTLQISPQLVPGSDSAIIDVHSTASEWQPHAPPDIRANGVATTAPAFSASAEQGIDRVNMLCQEMKTTARVPLKKKVIMGGMTLEPSNADQAGRQLYLVLELDQPR
jgi:hypothetical protein